MSEQPTTKHGPVNRNSIAMSVNAAFHGDMEACLDSSIGELEYGIEKLSWALSDEGTLGSDLSPTEARQALETFAITLSSMQEAAQWLEKLAEDWGD